jgi:hypothetical protein
MDYYALCHFIWLLRDGKRISSDEKTKKKKMKKITKF